MARVKVKVSILIPCYNEEKTIARCIESCLNQSRKPHEIIVVNDGSSDGTLEILTRYEKHIRIIDLEENSGNKSYAEERGLAYVTGNVFVTTDADTELHPDFVKQIMRDFKDRNVMAVSGYVKSKAYNALTAVREIEYLIAQNIHKRAQGVLNSIIVIPGCAAAYRTAYFKERIGFDHASLAEDMEFTFKLNIEDQIIAFNRNAIVYTQDPHDLKSYIHQMKRWYLGGWQNFFRYNQHLKSYAQRIELSLIYSETFIFSFILLILPFLNLKFFGYIVAFQLVVAFAIALYGTRKFGRKDLLLSFPLYPVIAYLNAALFIGQLFRLITSGKNRAFAWISPARRDA
jgi:cellulose synthase/poly-beta-1,6-N-acetylglucosamine synthase-like glycosyltransferase